ncbi:DUF2177 family protein [Sphingomonas oryzagri]|uniref:DUF2177 family protein n=1 Tax=Sphingomonas oryzagri TaxID=3042314 RepID=A0ABT6N5Y4_9SPHN|nr:DUF2177 family protein [Sphingomonas oryzagri]MDH7640508.1 DUF2177 family protein [Sphingomonas oryzagri]
MIGTWISTAFATGISFLALDSIWLSLAASRLYRPRLGPLLLERFDVAPAAAFYLIYLAGILIFAIAPALVTGRWTSALARGAMLGLVAYATYDLTNQATLRGWSATVTVADLCWGMCVTATAATIGFTVARWMLARG